MQHLEHILQKLLLKDIIISTEKKVLKRGKLKLFNIKQFYIKLVLETVKSGNKIYEIPYPFGAQNYKDGVLFNYTLSSFCKPDTDAHSKLKLFNKTDSSKLYDNFMFILPLSSTRL